MNFLYDNKIEKLLELYGIVCVIKIETWKKLPKLYNFSLKEAGPISYLVTTSSTQKQHKLF
jgi:hypothetical protein